MTGRGAHNVMITMAWSVNAEQCPEVHCCLAFTVCSDPGWVQQRVGHPTACYMHWSYSTVQQRVAHPTACCMHWSYSTSRSANCAVYMCYRFRLHFYDTKMSSKILNCYWNVKTSIFISQVIAKLSNRKQNRNSVLHIGWMHHIFAHEK